MTNHGDDCYFFYYSTCTKGDTCPFRHCEAAMGNETVCNLWQEGRCFRAVCKFRHMEITKNRKEIPCYWENQPAGCQKSHCAFFHDKPRYIQGVFVPPDKGVKTEEQQHEEPPPPPPAPLPTTANPQLRGVIKTDTSEPVPSPTHPPVVINPADDDEDEDDQFSEEGEDGKVGPSPRKLTKSGDSLNFGVSTLEEIRLRKALKASMKKVGYPLQCAETSTNGEKENIQAVFRPPLFEDRDGPLVFEETSRPRGSVAERLGRKIPSAGVKSGETNSLKRSLAARLGKVVDEEPPQKSVKSVRERLGMVSGSDAPSQPDESSLVSKKVPEEIRIKTLEEIKQEKAAKSQSQSLKDAPSAVAPKNTVIKTTNRGIKRAITVKDTSVGQVKTFSEIIRAKKKRQEEEQNSSPTMTNNTAEKGLSRNQEEPGTAGSGPETTSVTEVRVKTLEEIRREKAARIQIQQATEAKNSKSPDAEENGAKKPRLKKLVPQVATKSVPENTTKEKSAELTVKSQNTPPAASQTTNVKVKTFEEIMREKRLRKQEMEAKSSTEEKPPQNQASAVSLRRKFTSPGSSSPSATAAAPDSTLPTQKEPVCKLTALKSKAASPQSNTATPDTTVACVPVKEGSSPEQSLSSSRQTPEKNTKTSTSPLTAKQARASSQDPAVEATTTRKKSPATDPKVRPKLNVKPSVMKPAVQLKPGQKRRGAERSAVAAVKPLNSASTALEEPLQDTTCRDRQAFPSFSAEAQLSSAVPRSPSTLLDCGSSSSPLTEDLQTVPVFKKSPGKESQPAVNAAATREACTVPQSPVPNTPTQSKPRRTSVAVTRAASTSAASTVDDFEDLINEFTDDQLEDDMDPAIGEDDLLQELSEMIDS